MIDKKKILSLNSCSIGYKSVKQTNLLLEKLSLELHEGELVALIGLNGSGKSSLLKTILNLQESLDGDIFISDKNLKDYSSSELARIIAFVKANWQPDDNMTVEDLVRLGRFPYTNFFGKLEASDNEIVDESIRKLSLEELRDRPLSLVSDGERQRAMLARVFAQKSKIVVLDEPTAFLDIQHKYETITRLKSLCENGITVLFSTHDLQLASHFADRFWLIRDKTIVEGAPEDMILNGSMIKLVDSDDVMFDDAIGDFLPKRISDKSIVLEYDESHALIAKWTKKALGRIGYKIKEKISDLPSIKIITENNKYIWILHQDNEHLQCSSILELINNINK